MNKKKPGRGMVLTNQDIFSAREPLGNLMGQKFHVRVSYNLAKLASILQVQLKVIDEVRTRIITKYGKPDKANPQQIVVTPILEKTDAKGEVVMEVNPDFEKYVEELAELMATEETIDFGNLDVPVKLPEKVASTCDKCHHNMDKALEIEPGILLLLLKFVTID